MAKRFSDQVAEYGEMAMERYDQVRRASILELFSLVIQRSPVDTGRFRGNWQTTLNNGASGTLAREDKGGTEATAEILANMGTMLDVVYMTNNLAYSDALERGYSAQAPNGMVGRSIIQWKDIVSAKVRAFGGGT